MKNANPSPNTLAETISSLTDEALRRAAPRLSREPRRDLTQEVVARVLAERTDGVEPEAPLSERVGVKAAEVLREHAEAERERCACVRFASERLEGGEEPAVRHDRVVIAPWVWAAWATLPAYDARLLRLRYVEGATFDDIADALGLSVRVATQRHDRIVSRLRRRLGLKRPRA